MPFKFLCPEPRLIDGEKYTSSRLSHQHRHQYGHQHLTNVTDVTMVRTVPYGALAQSG